MTARRPTRRRSNPKRLAIREIPEGVDLDQVASRCRYLGSPYHKQNPGFAGMPRRRLGANLCPRELANDQTRVQAWLQAAVRAGTTGRWDSRRRFPLEVFHREGQLVFVAITGTGGSGAYHGFPLESWENVRGLADGTSN
jgi:hypothetical protein